jgi:hypothetical protein
MNTTTFHYEVAQAVNQLGVYAENAHDRSDTSPWGRQATRSAQNVARRNARRYREILRTSDGAPELHSPMADLWESLAEFTPPSDNVLETLATLDASLGDAARAAAEATK